VPEPTCQIVPATLPLVRQMAPRLRAADTAEVWAARHWTPLEALEQSVALSPMPRALLINGQPAAAWGVEPIARLAGVGCSWLLGTDLVASHPMIFWRTCKAELERMLTVWRVVLNWIQFEYQASIRWARRLGFRVDEPRPFGPDGVLFCCAAIVADTGAR